MYEKIIAIDVASRIPQFLARAGSLARDPIVVNASTSEVNDFDADAIVTSYYQDLDRKFLEKFSRLKYIGVLGSSTKKIDVDYCRAKQITVRKVDDYCDAETAEWVIWQLLKYFRDRSPAHSVCGKSLGLIGVGAVGKKVMTRALALEMTVKFFTPSAHPELVAMGAEPASVAEILSWADVVSSHSPPHTPWLDQKLLAHIKDGALLINTSMGKISHGEDLEQFLATRSDVQLIMDGIAKKAYPSLSKYAHDNLAYLTIDSEKRLVDKFFANLAIS